MRTGKDENHGNAGVRGRRRGNIKVKGNMRKNGINNYGIWGGNMYIIYEPTLKSKACFRCLFITKIISG